MTNMQKLFCVSLLVFFSTGYAQAFEYAQFENNIKEIVKSITKQCKADGIGSTLDNRQFQKDCGLAMQGRKFSGVEASVFFSSEELENGFLDIMGIENQFSGDDGKVYSLVRSLNTQVHRPHYSSETSTSSADATLFVKQEQDGHKNNWQLVWRFVNPHTNDWLKANPLFPKQQGLTPEVATMIDRLWREVVVKGTAKLAFTIKDSTGPVFTARNPKVR
ncbi:MAG: hypothetical protein HWE30_00955 [Methylocystaceae bacterium]|nr:hypothetical protein [Methylocystaceae bacterium]